MRGITPILTLVIAASVAEPSHAVIGQLIRKTIASAGKRSTTVVRQGSKDIVKHVAPRGLSKAGTVVRQGSRLKLKPLMTSGTRSAVKVGNAASKEVVEALGVEGLKSLQKLTPTAQRKFAAMSGAIAKSPHRTKWLDTIAKHGDQAINWLWRNKGGVAVGTTATAILAKPDEFIQMAGSVAETAVEATTKHVVAPVVRSASLHLATSLIAAIAASVGVVALWTTGGLTGLLTVCGLSKWTWQKIRSK